MACFGYLMVVAVFLEQARTQPWKFNPRRNPRV
jgi:hypothetical protein